VAAAALETRADYAVLAPREVPANSLQVPTDVSPGMQKFIATPLNPTVAEPTLLGFVWENRNAVDLDQNLD
jgi:hypothetical protein